MTREMLGVAAVGAAGAVIQERLRNRPVVMAATGAGIALLGAYATHDPDIALMLGLLLLVGALTLTIS